MRSSICIPIVGLIAVLNAAICVAVRSRLVERVPLLLDVSIYPCLSVSSLSGISCVLIVLKLGMLSPLIMLHAGALLLSGWRSLVSRRPTPLQ